MGFRDLLTPENQNWVMPSATSNMPAFSDIVAGGKSRDENGNFLFDPSKNQNIGDVLSQEDWLAKQRQLGYSDPMIRPQGDGEDSNYAYYLYTQEMANAQKELADYQLKQTDPKAYYAQKSQELADGIFNAFTVNNSVMGGGNNVGKWTQQLEDIKQIDPAAYYNAVLSLDLRKAGWDAGQGKTNDITNARIQSNLNDAAKAGAINADQYQNLVANNYANTANWHAQNIANRAGDQGTLNGLPQFALTAAGLGVGLGGLIGALAPAALAAEGGAALAGTDAYMAAAGLNPGTFEGAAFALPEFAASAPQYAGINDYMSQAGMDAGNFNSFTPTNPLTDYMNQAGLETGNFEGANFQMPTDTTAKDVLNAANNARKAYGLANTLAKIGGGNSGVGGTAGSTTSGTDLSKLASLLAPKPYQGIELAQIQAKNPFLFNTPGQTQASQGMYDVSGSNLANALRKA